MIAGGAGRRIALVALGSVLEADDGVGAVVLAELVARWQLPATVEALDLGTPGPYLAEHLRGFAAVLVLDAVHADAPAGTVVVERDLSRLRNRRGRLSPHDPNLGEALGVLSLAGEAPAEVVIVGVVPNQVELGTRLSPPVAAAVPAAVTAAAQELARLGAAVEPRPTPEVADLWWASAAEAP